MPRVIDLGTFANLARIIPSCSFEHLVDLTFSYQLFRTATSCGRPDAFNSGNISDDRLDRAEH